METAALAPPALIELWAEGQKKEEPRSKEGVEMKC